MTNTINESTQSAPVITVDGPSGVGKGTVSLLLAKQLQWHYLDSGALYRLLAYAVDREGLDCADEARLAEKAAHLSLVFDSSGDQTVILLDGQEVTQAIRLEHVGRQASILASYPKVRQALLQRQRAFLKAPGLIADGRDMGTVIFPNAELKVFLVASAEERARRRCRQLTAQGHSIEFDQILHDIQDRDRRDRQRSLSPLVPAEDAVQIDTTLLSIEQVLQKILSQLRSQGLME